MKDKYKKIKKQSYISYFLSYCMYFYDIQLMHLLIDEIGQLGIITVYPRLTWLFHKWMDHNRVWA